jgi:hypothetical protein
MAERTDRQAQIDPWKDIDDREEYIGGTWYLTRDYVDAARSADAALLRERDAQIASLIKIVENTLWMAGRYADRRMTYAVGLYNDMLAQAEALGCANEAKPAVDGMDPERLSLMEQIASLRAERDAAQQENKTLREALERVKALVQGVSPVKALSAAADVWGIACNALSSSPRPQEPQP